MRVYTLCTCNQSVHALCLYAVDEYKSKSKGRVQIVGIQKKWFFVFIGLHFDYLSGAYIFV